MGKVKRVLGSDKALFYEGGIPGASKLSVIIIYLVVSLHSSGYTLEQIRGFLKHCPFVKKTDVDVHDLQTIVDKTQFQKHSQQERERQFRMIEPKFWDTYANAYFYNTHDGQCMCPFCDFNMSLAFNIKPAGSAK